MRTPCLSAPAQRLSTQMQCHLAFAKSRGFDRAPCPLYVQGVSISSSAGVIEVRSLVPSVAARVRLEGRRLFGEAAVVAN